MPTQSTDQLQKQLIELNKKKKEIVAISDSIEAALLKIDKITLAQASSCQALREKYFTELEKQLETNGSALTAVEKSDLRRIVSTPSTTKATLAELKKLDVKMPKDPSDFAVAAYKAVVATLSRGLKKTDKAAINEITKKLSVIDDEHSAFKKTIAGYASQYDSIIKSIAELKAQVEKLELLSDQEIKLIEQSAMSVTLDAQTEESPGFKTEDK